MSHKGTKEQRNTTKRYPNLSRLKKVTSGLTQQEEEVAWPYRPHRARVPAKNERPATATSNCSQSQALSNKLHHQRPETENYTFPEARPRTRPQNQMFVILAMFERHFTTASTTPG